MAFRMLASIGLTLAMAAIIAGRACGEPLTRSEVPIRQIVLSDGTRRYAVPIMVDGVAMEAGLDSGSVGLRVLSAGRPDTGQTMPGGWYRYGFGAGTVLEGPQAEDLVAIGEVRGRVAFQRVQNARCSSARPNCPASRIPFKAFGIEGDGLPGEGFRAILGIGLFGGQTPNPLVELGIRRWIIRLPRPGEAGVGLLVLNPTEAEIAEFRMLQMASAGTSRRDDAVQACLRTNGTNEFCAPTILDTGAPGIAVVNLKRRWRQDRDFSGGMSLNFSAVDGANRPSIAFEANQRSQGSHFSIETDERVEGEIIRSGIITYLSFDVLYDSEDRAIGLRLRTLYDRGPVAR